MFSDAKMQQYIQKLGPSEANYLQKEMQKYDLLLGWEETKNYGEDMDAPIKRWMEYEEIETIALFGAGYIGYIVWRALRNNPSVRVLYVIDNTLSFIDDLLVIKPQDLQDEDKPDAIIVTSLYQFEEVKKQLKEYVTCPIISLEEVILNYEYHRDVH